jgi:arginase
MPTNQKILYVLGSASAVAAPHAGCSEGPLALQQSPYMAKLSEQGIQLNWQAILTPKPVTATFTVDQVVATHCQQLAQAVSDMVANKCFFTVFGGDHSCAIGTWSGAYNIIGKQGDMGLIWIDAHMDSHTPETSETGNIHGMPLACLLGHGSSQLTHILTNQPKFKPEHISLIGVRSFESGEQELLKRLNVRIFYMAEVKARGLEAVMAEALKIATTGTVAYGVTLDIDSIDPVDAPGTGVSEPDGLSATELCRALKQVAGDARLIGIEIVEFDPYRDIDHKTEKLVPELLVAMTRV